MNIIIDEATHNELQQHIQSTIEFGSVMKNRQTLESDHDYLHIIRTSKEWLLAPYNTHHLLQFRAENGDDHIYCNVHTFVKSLLDGDSTIFHEIVRYSTLEQTPISFMKAYEFQLNHYKTLRGYLGLARRDLKEATKIWTKDQRKANKKYKFARAGASFVAVKLGLGTSIITTTRNDIESIADMQRVCKELSKTVDTMRTELNDQFDAGIILRSVDNETLAEIDAHLADVPLVSFTTGLDYFRDSFQNGN